MFFLFSMERAVLWKKWSMVYMIHVLSGKILWINLHLGELFCFLSSDEIDMSFVSCLGNNEYITLYVLYTGCPTIYQTWHFFTNSNTNEDIAMKFEQEYVHCVRNVTTS
jgi:hypothetical protein